jgi:hypothetical protein
MELKLTDVQLEMLNNTQAQINALQNEQRKILIALTSDKEYKNAKIQDGVLYWESSVKEEPLSKKEIIDIIKP